MKPIRQWMRYGRSGEFDVNSPKWKASHIFTNFRYTDECGRANNLSSPHFCHERFNNPPRPSSSSFPTKNKNNEKLRTWPPHWEKTGPMIDCRAKHWNERLCCQRQGRSCCPQFNESHLGTRPLPINPPRPCVEKNKTKETLLFGKKTDWLSKQGKKHQINSWLHISVGDRGSIAAEPTSQTHKVQSAKLGCWAGLINPRHNRRLGQLRVFLGWDVYWFHRQKEIGQWPERSSSYMIPWEERPLLFLSFTFGPARQEG